MWGFAILASAIVLGLGLGAIRIRGVRLGISGVLLTSLLFGQLGLTADDRVLDTLRDFSLVLFVYAIGLAVGPGFLNSLRADGLRLNMLSLLILVLGGVFAIMLVWLTRLPIEAGTGIFSGAYNTTPGLGAAQEAIRRAMGRSNEAISAGIAFAITYPFGMVGPILVILAMRKLLGVRVKEELEQLVAAEQLRNPPIEWRDFEVTNEAHTGIPLREHPLLRNKRIVFTRMLRDGKLSAPRGDSEFRIGDLYRAVGTRAEVDNFVAIMGKSTATDLGAEGGEIDRMDIVVTRPGVLRRSLQELDLIRRTGVTLAWINRSGITLSPRPGLRLQFGDRVRAVGPVEGLKMVETEFGNCPDALNRSQLVPIFLGIVLGVIVGSIPLAVPGLHGDLRIGLAGGALLAAVALSQLGNIGSIVWYMPLAANQLFRDFGLAVFLGCVGLRLGNHFLQSLASNNGLVLILCGALVTILPMLIVGLGARIFFKMNFVTLCGLLCGAMTNLPALSFANELTKSDLPASAFATVAPLAELVPIIVAQVLAGMIR